ncbi:WD40 repeat domain-containing protein [Ilumatobacter sp.]|uniref:WD40 repeat domain-containing protein n=1 Tax=Ilumatobacter sp. TaxID=1967498 RepID=UPI003C700E4F
MSWTIPSPALDISMDADGSQVAVAAAGCAWVYATNSGETRAVLVPDKEKKSAVTALAFTRSGGTLVAGNSNGTVQAWRSHNWDGVSVLKSLRGTGAITRIQFPLNGDAAFLASPGRLSWWDVATDVHRPIVLDDGSGEVSDFAVSADGRLVAVGTSSGALLLVDVASGAGVRQTAIPGSIAACDIAPDGATIVVSGSDGQLREWTSDGELHAAGLPVDRVTSIRFVSAAANLLTAGGDGMVHFWVGPADA